MFGLSLKAPVPNQHTKLDLQRRNTKVRQAQVSFVVS